MGEAGGFIGPDSVGLSVLFCVVSVFRGYRKERRGKTHAFDRRSSIERRDTHGEAGGLILPQDVESYIYIYR